VLKSVFFLSFILSFLYVFKVTASTFAHSLAISFLLGMPSILVLIQSDANQKFGFCGTSGLVGHLASAPAVGTDSDC
jgi:hypothetical protein